MAPRNKRKLQDITNDEDQGKNEPLAKTKQKRTQKVPDRFDTDEKEFVLVVFVQDGKIYVTTKEDVKVKPHNDNPNLFDVKWKDKEFYEATLVAKSSDKSALEKQRLHMMKEQKKAAAEVKEAAKKQPSVRRQMEEELQQAVDDSAETNPKLHTGDPKPVTENTCEPALDKTLPARKKNNKPPVAEATHQIPPNTTTQNDKPPETATHGTPEIPAPKNDKPMTATDGNPEIPAPKNDKPTTATDGTPKIPAPKNDKPPKTATNAILQIPGHQTNQTPSIQHENPSQQWNQSHSQQDQQHWYGQHSQQWNQPPHHGQWNQPTPHLGQWNQPTQHHGQWNQQTPHHSQWNQPTPQENGQSTVDLSHSNIFKLQETVTKLQRELKKEQEEKQKEVDEKIDLMSQIDALQREVEELRRNAAENLRPAGPVDVADEDIPKAGFVNIDTARKFNMVELVPQTGIFLYPANLDLARREKKSPTNLARKLLKNFHSPAQLAEFGSLLLVDRRIVDAILEFVRKETEEWKKKKTVAALHSDLRHMVSGLKREKTKNEAKKNAAEETEDSE